MAKAKKSEFYINLALNLAKKANPFPNPKVGAVVVRNGKIVGKGYHKKAGEHHAEIFALKEAGENAKGAILYVTLEPCSHTNKRTPPCTTEIIKSGIKKVVYAHKDPNPLVSGNEELKKAGIEIVGPILEEQAIRLNEKYSEKIHSPHFVVIKMAMSADGKTATKTGDSKWISSEKSRHAVYKLRSKFDAIMVGANTVIRDNPHLTLHKERSHNNEPYRIVIDGELNVLPNMRVFQYRDKKTIILTSEKALTHKKEKVARFKNSPILSCGKNKVDLQKALHILNQFGIKKILIEGGSELNATALEAGIVDKFYVIVAPKIIGGRNSKSVVGGEGIEKMKDATLLNLKSVKRIDGDIWLEYIVRK